MCSFSALPLRLGGVLASVFFTAPLASAELQKNNGGSTQIAGLLGQDEVRLEPGWV
jgi:hypothetical protein